jgi:hypothetical protein
LFLFIQIRYLRILIFQNLKKINKPGIVECIYNPVPALGRQRQEDLEFEAVWDT